MSSSMTATKVSTTRGSNDASAIDKPAFYKYLMTPVIFVSFLFSLAIIDIRYTFLRSKGRTHSRLPGWLYRLIYRPAAPSQGPTGPTQTNTAKSNDGYYRTKQKKLAKMEMADALEIRGLVVGVLTLLMVASAWGAWTGGRWIFGRLMTA